MKIEVVKYNQHWPEQFQKLKAELGILLRPLHPVIEHIGSTSVPGLSAKGVIDICVGVKNQHLFSDVVGYMHMHPQYIYYSVFNDVMPQRRLFVKLKDIDSVKEFGNVFSNREHIPHEEINSLRVAHVHVWEMDSRDWKRHLAFRDYLRKHEEVRKEYEALKLKLSQQEWKDGMAYNDGKNEFIKFHEAKAVEWHNSNL